MVNEAISAFKLRALPCSRMISENAYDQASERKDVDVWRIIPSGIWLPRLDETFLGPSGVQGASTLYLVGFKATLAPPDFY